MTEAKEKLYLKDTIAVKVLSSEDCREYLISIIALSLNMKKKDVKRNLRMVHPKIAVSSKYKNQETDIILENDMYVIDVEVNYNIYKNWKIKNTVYIGNLMVRQMKPKDDYKKMKPIRQINLDNYDYYGKRKIYIS